MAIKVIYCAFYILYAVLYFPCMHWARLFVTNFILSEGISAIHPSAVFHTKLWRWAQLAWLVFCYAILFVVKKKQALLACRCRMVFQGFILWLKYTNKNRITFYSSRLVLSVLHSQGTTLNFTAIKRIYTVCVYYLICLP